MMMSSLARPDSMPMLPQLLPNGVLTAASLTAFPRMPDGLTCYMRVQPCSIPCAPCTRSFAVLQTF